MHSTCQQKFQRCELSNIKQIAEDESLFQKLLWKKPCTLLTLDGDAFCAGFTHSVTLLCTLWLEKQAANTLTEYSFCCLLLKFC